MIVQITYCDVCKKETRITNVVGLYTGSQFVTPTFTKESTPILRSINKQHVCKQCVCKIKEFVNTLEEKE